MRAWLLVIAAGCASPSPSSLKPGIFVTNEGSYLTAQVGLADDPDVSVAFTFRGTTAHTWHAPQDYGANFTLDTPLASDEPLTIVIDGVEMTLTAPTAFDMIDVPLFISRTQSATVTWSPPSADKLSWYLYSSFCAASKGGDIPDNATSLTFSPADWMTQESGTCSTDVDLLRTRETPVDSAFAGGTAQFQLQQHLEFASTP